MSSICSGRGAAYRAVVRRSICPSRRRRARAARASARATRLLGHPLPRSGVPVHTVVDLVIAAEVAGERSGRPPLVADLDTDALADRFTREVAGAAGRPPRPPAVARWRA